MKKINIGSRVFFGEMPDYQENDCDVLFILDQWPEEITDTRFSCRKEKCDLFFMKEQTKEQYINDILQVEKVHASRVCFFLVPEIAQLIKLTIDDLKRVEPIVAMLKDTRHAWYYTLYESYIENDGFFLTDAQREKAYEEFKSARAGRRQWNQNRIIR